MLLRQTFGIATDNRKWLKKVVHCWLRRFPLPIQISWFVRVGLLLFSTWWSWVERVFSTITVVLRTPSDPETTPVTKLNILNWSNNNVLVLDWGHCMRETHFQMDVEISQGLGVFLRESVRESLPLWFPPFFLDFYRRFLRRHEFQEEGHISGCCLFHHSDEGSDCKKNG